MFKENIMELLEEFSKENSNPYLDYYCRDYSSDPDLQSIKCFTSEAWMTGGVTGGNCWNQAHRDVEAEEPKEIILLDKFLKENNFNLSFSQSQKLANFIKDQDWSDYGYYGNHVYYKCVYITFEDIADFLSQMEMDNKQN
jgi:hypothetical protein